MEQKIRKAVTVYVPGNLCNLRCSYCYVSECLQLGHEEKPRFCYSVKHMIKAFAPERIGGLAYFTVIGGGETLLPPEVIPFVKGLLRYGHVVEVVTNNTLNDKMDELLDMPESELRRLIVKCSLHWTELKRLNKLDDYFNNMRKVIAAGASTYPFLVICKEYESELEEICRTCQREIHALPQCTPCVLSDTQSDFLRGGAARTEPACTPELVQRVKELTHSKLFEESVRFLDIDPKKVFCYAGPWAFGVYMDTGKIFKCHNVLLEQNFFENIEEPLELDAVGCECGVATCSLQYPFFGLGLIPEVPDVPTYAQMVCDREGLFTDEVKALMDTKIVDDAQMFSDEEKIDFLMGRVSAQIEKVKEAGREINEQYAVMVEEKNLIKKQQEVIENLKKGKTDDEEGVRNLLLLIERGMTQYEELQNITYAHVLKLYEICVGMEDGENIYFRQLCEMYSGLIASHEYTDAGLFYEDGNDNVIKGIAEIPVTVLVAETRRMEEIRTLLEAKDIYEISKYMLRQIKGWRQK